MNMMNSITKIALAILLLAVVSISGCKDHAPNVQERVEGMLVSAEWNQPVVTVDGVDHSDLYQNFTIRFNKNTYTSSGGSPLWPAAGTWNFTDESAKAINLDGKMEIHINEITDVNLELAFQNDNTTFASGRVKSVGGKNVFRLKKK